MEICCDDMTDHQKPIVDAANGTADQFREELSKGELSARIRVRFL
jgi:hypothetical protein